MEDLKRANQEFLKAREEMKDGLVQKLSYKYGRGGAKDDDQVSISSTAIREEVDGMLVGAAAPVTQANLARLDRRLQRQAEQKAGVEDLQSVRSISQYTAASYMPRRVSGAASGSQSHRDSRPITPAMSGQGLAMGSARGSGSARFPISSRVGRAVLADAALAKRSAAIGCVGGGREKQLVADVDWSTLDRLAAKLHEKDAELYRHREKELQGRLKEDLAKQIVDSQLKQARERDQEQRHFETQIAVLGNWQEQERENKGVAREKALVIQRDRDRQIQSDRVRKEQDRQRVIRDAEELVQRVQREEAEDKQETEQRREMRKERARKALEDGSLAAHQREQALSSKMQREDELMEDYYARKDERDRQCKEDVHQKVIVRREMLESTAATKYKAERQKQDEATAQAAKEQAAKDARDIENEIKKNARLSSQRLETQKYLFDQMKMKTEVKEKEKDQKKTLGSALEVDAQKYIETEFTREKTKKERALEHRAELERQIALKMSSPRKKDAMSSSEVAMNKKLLERVERLDEISGVGFLSTM